VVHREGKLGIGSAPRAGIAYAYDKGYDLLITLDADFSHSPADLPRLLAAHASDVDVVVASRYLGPDSLPGWSPHRLFLTRLGHFLTRVLLRMPYDACGAFRRSRPIDRLRPELVESQGWDEYWSEKRTALGTLYDLVAAVYRRVIRRNLRRYAERSFAAGARVLHAGCGSGQVDAGLHERFR